MHVFALLSIESFTLFVSRKTVPVNLRKINKEKGFPVKEKVEHL